MAPLLHRAAIISVKNRRRFSALCFIGFRRMNVTSRSVQRRGCVTFDLVIGQRGHCSRAMPPELSCTGMKATRSRSRQSVIISDPLNSPVWHACEKPCTPVRRSTHECCEYRYIFSPKIMCTIQLQWSTQVKDINAHIGYMCINIFYLCRPL